MSTQQTTPAPAPAPVTATKVNSLLAGETVSSATYCPHCRTKAKTTHGRHMGCHACGMVKNQIDGRKNSRGR